MAKKTTARKTIVPVPPQFEAKHTMPVETKKASFSWKWMLGLMAIALLILVSANKGLIVAAIVDGRPIFSWQLNSTLRTRYGQQTLEGMIGEVLIQKEAQKAGVTVSADDLKGKQKEILSSLGTEVSLEDFLKFQGMTETDFNQQLKMQLTVERLLTKNMNVSEADIDNFIATNSATLMATEPAKLREEAKKAIMNNEVSEKLQPWFLELRQKSTVMKFL